MPTEQIKTRFLDKEQASWYYKVKTITAIIILLTAMISYGLKNHNDLIYNESFILILSLSLLIKNFIFYKKKIIKTISSLLHQVCICIGLFFTMIIVTNWVSTGFISSNQAGKLLLLIMSFTLFIIGIYSDLTIMLTGLTLLISLFISACSYHNTTLLNTSLTLGFLAAIPFINYISFRTTQTGK
jgi:hypothetical protein